MVGFESAANTSLSNNRSLRSSEKHSFKKGSVYVDRYPIVVDQGKMDSLHTKAYQKAIFRFSMIIVAVSLLFYCIYLYQK